LDIELERMLDETMIMGSMWKVQPMPHLKGILETSLYTEDMDRARAFYEDVLGLSPIFSDSRLTAYAIERNVLLLFRKGTTGEPVKLKDGHIPRHGGTGELHVAFPIGKNEMQSWLDHLAEHGVGIEGRNGWSRGGESVYFRDPDGNLLELATPGLWSVY
jgi:catechol 2,3-dioxygenase-like lactoylglutathione lyase family enzyme